MSVKVYMKGKKDIFKCKSINNHTSNERYDMRNHLISLHRINVHVSNDVYIELCAEILTQFVLTFLTVPYRYFDYS